jgi:hypothetical protein
MVMKRFLAILCMAGLPAAAQWRTGGWRHFGDEPARPTGFVGLGLSTPVNPLAASLKEGWNFAGGAGFTKDYVGLMADVVFADFGMNDAALASAGARKGSQRFWGVTVDPVFHVNERGPVDFYLTGGLGLYALTTSLRAYSNQAGPSGTRYYLISSDTLARPGVNGGAGFSFSLDPASNVKFFIEARYHHMFTRAQGSSFVPVTVGVRF